MVLSSAVLFFTIINQVINNKQYKKFLLVFLSYSFLLLCSLITINNIIYLYLMFKLLNISIYIVLIHYSNNPINFKSVVNYYFLSFISSILFLFSIYNFSENIISIYLINISLLLKLGIYPFSNVISKIYSNSSFLSFLILSYIINFQYIYLLYIFNQINYLYTTHVFYIKIFVTIITISTLLYTYNFFNKQIELKGFIAFSSITNTPIIINVSLISIFSSFIGSKNNYDMLILYFLVYIFIYGLNYFIISVLCILIEPIKTKQYLKNKTYFTSIANMLYDYSNKFKDLLSILLLIICGFPPTFLFIIKFHLFCFMLINNNMFFVLLLLIILNTLIIICYLTLLGRILSSISAPKLYYFG